MAQPQNGNGTGAPGRSSSVASAAAAASPVDSPVESGAAAAAGSASDLLPQVYDQLRRLAQLRMSKEHEDHTLQATALVHEVFVRLSADAEPPGRFANAAHFYAAAAEAMRRILIDHARARVTHRRGGLRQRFNLSTVLDLAAAPATEDILALDDALTCLERESPDVAAVVRMRFYAGLSVAETAKALGVAPRTVDRDWAYARTWLHRHLREADGGEADK